MESLGPGGVPGTPGMADDSRFSVNFPGGTIDDYVALLRELAADSNIVVLGDAGKLRLPPFSLRNVDVFVATPLLDHVRLHVPIADDDALLQHLTAAGRTDGLVRIGESVLLVTRDAHLPNGG